MFLVKMAFRNLARHKRRTLITASVIALGLLLYLFIDSLLIGMTEMSFQNIIDLESGHLLITTADYWEERNQIPLDNLINYTEILEKGIVGTPEILDMAPRLKFSANLNNGIDELPITVIGIEPTREVQVFTIEEYLVAGYMPKRGKQQAILGKTLAELMDFQVGDYLTLILKSKDGAFNTIEAEITGLMNTPNPSVNDMVYVPLDIAQRALNLENKVSEIVIRLNNEKVISSLSKTLTSTLKRWPELTVKTWRESAASVIAMSKAQGIENQFIISIILIMAAVGIVNTILLSALERLKETGMLKAMGMTEWEIIFAFMMESVGIGLLGGILGCVLGAISVWLLTIYGMDLAWFGAGDINYGIPIVGRFYGQWNLSAFIFVFLFGIIVSLVSSIIPARWAARKNPIDAIYQR